MARAAVTIPVMWWIVGVVAVVALVATYLTWLASRVDRLHARAASAQGALEAHLERRRAIASSLAQALDRPDLAAVVAVAATAQPDEREAAENDLTSALRALPYPVDSPVLTEVGVASRRVALARQVHNDLARDALAMRRRLLVRALRLTRRHPQPRYFDVDDPVLGMPTAGRVDGVDSGDPDQPDLRTAAPDAGRSGVPAGNSAPVERG